MSRRVSPNQRFTASRPCPICGGAESDPRGVGRRCNGYVSHDGQYAYCSRAEFAGGLPLYGDTGAYAHTLEASCGCGARHDRAAGQLPSATARNGFEPRPKPMRPRRFEIRNEAGRVVAVHVRRESEDRHPDTGKPLKQYHWEQPDGSLGLNGLSEKALPLYGASELAVLPDHAVVVVTEGEPARDALRAHGIPAVATVTGAKTTHDAESFRPLLRFRAVLWPDHDHDGRKHMELTAVPLKAIGHPDVRQLTWVAAPPKGDAVDFFNAGHTLEEARALLEAAAPIELDVSVEPEREARDLIHAKPARRGIWTQAITVGEFLNTTDPEVSWLEEHVVAPGAITELFSPRGLGKTHVAYAIAVKLAQRGVRVLLLDRDNSRREVKRRLKAWGGGGLTTFKVLLRDQVPPLTDAPAWADFPFQDWDLVIVDSLDATTEGVGEKDSGKPSKAIAPMLDIAHRADGPAILVLGNTIKSGEHGRGSGVIEDRWDIAYEVRDATDLKPSGTKDWWLELPPSGAGAWAERASRRKRRDSYRLAFVPSKFRIGEEPEPFVYEINLALEPWSLRLVTTEIVQAGQEARAEVERERTERQDRAADGVLAVISLRAGAGDPMTTAQVTEYLRTEHHLRRQEARTLIESRTGALWEAREDPTLRGKPKLWHPISPAGRVVENVLAAEIPRQESGPLAGLPAGAISADRMERARQKYPLAETRVNGGDSEIPISAAEPENPGAPEPGEERL